MGGEHFLWVNARHAGAALPPVSRDIAGHGMGDAGERFIRQNIVCNMIIVTRKKVLLDGPGLTLTLNRSNSAITQ